MSFVSKITFEFFSINWIWGMSPNLYFIIIIICAYLSFSFSFFRFILTTITLLIILIKRSYFSFLVIRFKNFILFSLICCGGFWDGEKLFDYPIYYPFRMLTPSFSSTFKIFLSNSLAKVNVWNKVIVWLFWFSRLSLNLVVFW